eukprot:874753-Amphidinium_carterae.1
MYPEGTRLQCGAKLALGAKRIPLAVPGLDMCLRPSKRVGPGHEIRLMRDSVSLRVLGLVCLRCAAYSSQRWGGLAAPCSCSIKGRAAQWSRVRRGLHPSGRCKVRLLLEHWNGNYGDEEAAKISIDENGNYGDQEAAENSIGMKVRQAWEM